MFGSLIGFTIHFGCLSLEDKLVTHFSFSLNAMTMCIVTEVFIHNLWSLCWGWCFLASHFLLDFPAVLTFLLAIAATNVKVIISV